MTRRHGPPPPGPPTVRNEVAEIWDEIRFTLGHIRDLPRFWAARRRWDRGYRGFF